METINIKGKEYITVNERLKFFWANYKGFRIITECKLLPEREVLFKATILNDKNEVVAIGHAHEKESASYINKTSFIENCETSAVGRALGIFGVGIDTSVASAEEINNAINNQR